ncbi:MAG: Flp pilus assembly protein CpaB [Alphaproteobacteria bacterium]|nr:Flp pilus assembly protein CpaB [Hyphomonas sp.]MBR9808108.1 Flp pilus assembly protein CpaB [Alphaproteobacteria bacterium]|tara:strand:+ start:4174 stop:5022 length:849 start_codon:yes stop_codon:yes gene_type:complete
MSPIRLIILVGAAIAAIAAAFLVRNMAQAPAPQAPAPVVETREISQTRVLVAKRNLQVGEMIVPEDMRWADWPESNVLNTYSTEAADPDAMQKLSGSIVRIPIYEKEPIMDTKLVMKGDTGTMAALLTPGMRAIAVEISVESATGGFILPNDHVDVILTYEVDAGSSGGSSDDKMPITKTVLQNVRVLAIDQVYNMDEFGGATQIGSTATLEVTGEEAELIAYSERRGVLSLSLRSWSDVGEGESRKARSDLLNSAGNTPMESGVVVYKNGQPDMPSRPWGR